MSDDQTSPGIVLCVRDNGGRTIDRYSVVLRTGTTPGMLDCLGLSSDPASPQGFSQWGDCKDGDHMGRTIPWTDLPENVRRHALERLREC